MTPTGGQVCNTVSVSADEGDPNPGNNSATFCVDLTPQEETACNTVTVADSEVDPSAANGTATSCVTVIPAAEEEGDVDGDGSVTVRDLLIVAALLGSDPLTWPGADVDGDGAITLVDLVGVASRM